MQRKKLIIKLVTICDSIIFYIKNISSSHLITNKISYLSFQILFVTSLIHFTNAQVGIGTDKVESGLILKISGSPSPESNFRGGLLLPNINLKSSSEISPIIGTPVEGLIIYNTTKTSGENALSPGIYYWNATQNGWDDIYNPIKNDICKFSNQRTEDNFNDESTYMDLFANQALNENAQLYRKIDATTLRINETGLYRVTLNLDMWVRQTGQDRDVFGIGIYLNDIRVSGQIVVMTNERASGTTQTLGKTTTQFITVPAGGGNLRVRGYEIHGASDVFFRNSRTSSISIERVR